jgi:maltose 6'-phosphate phosphatase
MEGIELLYAKNITSREGDDPRQELRFVLLVENLAYRKEVDVVWSGEDGLWRELKAEYLSPAGRNLELWQAGATFQRSSSGSLPGDVRFALRCRVPGREYWDNNHSRDYLIAAGSGIMAREGVSILNLGFCPHLQRRQTTHTVTVAVRRSLRPGRAAIVWTTDRWKTQSETACSRQDDYGYRALRSRGGSSGEASGNNGWEIWTAPLEIGYAYRVEYAVFCDTETGKIWDSNLGRNYHARRESLKILTLNLHCFQEDEQEAKFEQIAGAIRDLKTDIVCLQEVGEKWNDGKGDRSSNAARMIRDRLRNSHRLFYHLYTDWCHMGFNRYREGIAILSRYRFLGKDSEYISKNRDIHDIHTRKAVMVRVYVPYIGLINVFSAHLSWWNDGFREQFETLRRWANVRHTPNVAATLLCGDFNVKAGSEGYTWIVNNREYEDQFLRATSRPAFQKIFRQPSNGWEDDLRNDSRIDYIFLKKGSPLKVASARLLFTEETYGRVSDHYGYHAEFEPE